MFFFASSMPLRIASGTSPAFTNTKTNGTVAVTHDYQCSELVDTTALDGFGDAADVYDLSLRIQFRCINTSQKCPSLS